MMTDWDKAYLGHNEAGNIWFDYPTQLPLTAWEKAEFIAIYTLAAITSICAMTALFKWAFQ